MTQLIYIKFQKNKLSEIIANEMEDEILEVKKVGSYNEE